MSEPGPTMVLPDEGGLVVAFDTETSGLFVDEGARVSVVSVAWWGDSDGVDREDGRVTSYAWAFDQGVRDKLPMGVLEFGEDPNQPEGEWRWLIDWLSRQHLVAHNAPFDCHMIEAGTRHWPGVDLMDRVVWDTQVVNREVWPLETTSLKPSAKRLGLMRGVAGRGEVDEDAEQQAVKAALKSMKLKGALAKRYDLVEWDIIRPYAALDAELTIRLLSRQMDEIEGGACRMSNAQFKIEVMKVLYRMEQRGMAYDAPRSLEVARRLRQRLDELKAAMPFQPPTPAGARRWFFGRPEEGGLGHIPIRDKVTPGGQPQVDDEVLRVLEERGAPGAKEFAEYSKVSKAISMWYDGWAKAVGTDGRLRTSFRQTHVRSGRMSVERVQLQAVPKDDKALDLDGVVPVKQLFGARPGHELWNLDLSQAELRVAARYANCRQMLRLLAEGADLHGVTTKALFGVNEQHPDWAVKRDIGKRATFASIFQVGPRTFRAFLSKQAEIELSLREAEEIIQGWRNLYPEFGWAYRRAEMVVRNRGWVRQMPNTPYEIRSWFGPMDYPNTGWSRMVQGSLALFNQVWLVETEKHWPRILVTNVHDSQAVEVPAAGYVDAAGRRYTSAEEVAYAIADHAAELATGLFRITMKVDVSAWKSVYGERPEPVSA